MGFEDRSKDSSGGSKCGDQKWIEEDKGMMRVSSSRGSVIEGVDKSI